MQVPFWKASQRNLVNQREQVKPQMQFAEGGMIGKL